MTPPTPAVCDRCHRLACSCGDSGAALGIAGVAIAALLVIAAGACILLAWITP